MWTLLLITSIAAVSAEPLTFHGDKVFRIVPQTIEHVELLKSIASQTKLDFWVPDSVSLLEEGKTTDFRAQYDVAYDVQALIAQSGMPFEVLIDDVQVAIDNQLNSNVRSVHSYEKYNDLETIYAWTANIAAQNPDLVTRSQIGTSYEGRPIYLLKVGKAGANKNAVFIDCGFHAREWVTPAFCQWFVKEAVNSYGSDPEFTNLLDTLDFYVVPVLNVDGYTYTWTNDRMWRKTRSFNKNTPCTGTDPNRNFAAAWGTNGATSSPCSEVYCGTTPESESETRALGDFIRSNLSSIKAYLTIHSYSQMLLFPYSYKHKLAKDYDELFALAEGAVNALSSLYGTTYTYGPGGKTIYLSSGGSDDWAYDTGVKYSFTFELRDTGKYGFILPESEIVETCEETMLAIKYIANHVLNNA
ncbi:PREDICTED: carboxypeptidase B-like [Nanorana parkeri]|uniref:carboxypeptidase B-like n=1 Tax=Nanorana parkeri TaxID=125878 RepID=UPI0008550C2F|nr:PREDICTED: carboxypeptidase B-like [Nanorana parkeri]